MPDVDSGVARPRADHVVAQKAGQTAIPLSDLDAEVALVAGSQLVTTEAGRDREALAGGLTDKKVGSGARVADRLVEDPGQRMDGVCDLGLDDDLLVVGAEAVGDQPSVTALVELTILVGEAEREGVDGGALPSHGRHDPAGIHAARQEHTEGDVGHEMTGDRVVEAVPERVDPFALGPLFERAGGQLPVAAEHGRSARVLDQVVAGQDFSDLPEDGPRRRDVQEREELIERDLVERGGISTARSS